ncbi:MAG: hypothetical protein HY703_02650, partial [Gemmatimonadetes bacterium]|nr:hypothetical protein [Gemmatimonadota bacterium]
MSAERAARRPGPRPTAALLALAVAALACAVYLNSLANGFAMDDVAVIQRNDRLHSAGRLLEVLTTPYWPAKEPIASPYRPVTSLSFALNWAAGRGHPGAFHAVNVLLHAAVAALLLLLLLRLGLPAAAATLGAAVFALHPVHTEAVANIVGRAELLVACFVLIAALAYLRSTARPWLRIPAIALAYALALGSKENAIVLPALLVLLELFRPDRDRPLRTALWRERWVYIALILVTAGFAAVRSPVLGVLTSGDVAAYIAGLSTSSRIATALRIWPEYLRLLFYPRDLIADYGPGVIFPVTSWDPR